MINYTRKHSSLISTLFIRLVLTSLGAALIIFGILFYNLNSTINTLHDRGLISQVKDIENFLKKGKTGSVTLQLPEKLAQTYNQDNNNFAYAIIDISDTVIFSSKKKKTPIYPLGPHIKSETPEYFQFTDPETGEKINGVTQHIHLDNKHYRIQVTQGTEHPDVLTDSIFEQFTETTAIIIVLLITVVWIYNMVTIHRALKPLQAASQIAKNINPNHLDVRIPEGNLPMEILPLVQAVNSALARLETGFQMQRDFTADAAHQLRTPLSILSARIDKLSANQEYHALKSDIRAMTRIVGQLLKSAQLEVFILDENEQADLSSICIAVAAELGPLAIKQDKSISVAGADHPVTVKGNTESLHHAILNLVENALKHTPCKTAVEIEVSAEGIIRVRDYGFGIPEEDRQNVFERFWRGNKDSSGAGLGLAIVSRIIDVHHGQIKVSNAPSEYSQQPGCEFVISLP